MHGLANGFKSWTWENNAFSRLNWLEAALAKEDYGTETRIMTYSYQSTLLKSHADVRTTLHSRARDLVHRIVNLRREDNTSDRPLLFIAHSLGGLLVKQALVYSACTTDIDLRRIELLTGGIVFFGTPDDATSPSSLASIVKKLAALSPDFDGCLEDDDGQLRSDAQWLQNDLASFNPIRSKIKILPIYEMKPTSFKSGKSMVRPLTPVNSAAIINTGQIVDVPRPLRDMHDGPRIMLQRKHTGLVKFGGKEDPEYVKFRTEFQKLLIEAKELAEEKLGLSKIDAAMKRLMNQPPSPQQFVRSQFEMVIRHELRGKFHQSLEKTRSTEGFNIVTVHGPPGAGKTTLVRDYSSQLADQGIFVFWLNAESRQSITVSYLNLLKVIAREYSSRYHAEHGSHPHNSEAWVERAMGIPSPQAMLEKNFAKLIDSIEIQSAVKAVKNWLLMDEISWFLVFDNVRPGYSLLEFIPLSKRGQLVLISEERKHCPWGEAIEIKEWEDYEAMKLFNKLMNDSEPAGGISATMPAFHFSEEESRQIVDRLGSQPLIITSAAKYLLATQKSPSVFLHSLSASEIFLDTLDQSLTRQILQVCSVLSNDAVPYQFLLFIHNDSNELVKILDDLEHRSVLLRISEPDASTISQRTGDAELRDGYILNRNARRWIKERWVADEDDEVESAWMASRCCTGLIRQQSSASIVLQARQSEKSITPHAKACFAMSDRINERLYSMWRRNAQNRPGVEWQVLGGLFMRQGLRDEAIQCFLLALKSHDKMDSREQIETRLDLITLYQQQGKTKLAQCKEQLKRINMDRLDSGLRDRTLDRRIELAMAIEAVAEGELDMATKHYKQLDTYQEEDLGSTDTRTIFTVHKLAAVLKRLGRMDDAEAKYKQALLSYKIVFGDNNAVTLEAAEELAQVLQMRGAFARAEDLFEWTMSIKKKTLGTQHPSTALSVAKYAALCDMKGDFDEADNMYTKAFAVMEQSLGLSHPIYLATMENQALSYRKRANQLFAQTNRDCQQSDTQPDEKQVAQYSLDYERAASILSAVIDRKKQNPQLYKDQSIRGTEAKMTKMCETERYFKDDDTGDSRPGYLAPEARVSNKASRID